MSDQMVPPPPPPPPSNVPPPPPGGGFDANAAVAQFKGADPLDLAVVGAGVLALVFSFIGSYYTISGFGHSANIGSAWHGFFSWAGVLLLLAASGVVSAKIVKVQIPNAEIIGVATAVGGLLFTFLAMFVDAGDTGLLSGTGISEGRGWTYWIILILALVSGGVTGLKFAKARGFVK